MYSSLDGHFYEINYKKFSLQKQNVEQKFQYFLTVAQVKDRQYISEFVC
jgi:hypothetical protein